MPSLLSRRKVQSQVSAPSASPLPTLSNSTPTPDPVETSVEASPRVSNPWGFPMAPPPSSPPSSRVGLLIELPDVFVFPPVEDPVQEALCVWDSKTEAVNIEASDVESGLMDNPKGPDWIGLSEALKYIRDAHADVPPFRRMSEEELETSSVVMPRKSTSSLSSGTSSSWSKCSIDTDPTSLAYADIPSISTPTKQKMFGAIRLAFRGSISKVGQELKPSTSSSPPTSAPPSKRRRMPVSVPDVSKLGDLPSETSTKLVRRASSPGPQELLQLERENKFIPRRPGSPPPSKSFPVQTQAPPSPNNLAPSLPHSPSIECIPDLLATRASLPPLQAQRPSGNANNGTSTDLSSQPSIPAPVSSLIISTPVSKPAASLALPISAETMVGSTISTFESSAFTAKPETLRGIANVSELGVLKGTANNKTTTAVDPPRRTSPPTSSLTEASPAATLAPGARPRSLSGTFSRLFKRSAAPALATTPAPRSPKSSAFATPSAPVKPSVSVGLAIPSKTPTSAMSLSQTTNSPQSDPEPVDALESQTAPKLPRIRELQCISLILPRRSIHCLFGGPSLLGW
ncbi:hypothetical protein BS47DRAFT_18491 [Hydnum rufescens UP504]|uniref:Uncharacterized protein n=1 Tax=Hydnum rufescens UP504 TaxID=1448309 RepID=A0A9P6BBN0_9AGAM|nr:hypothetical protein BS47DRAFT_18491 [Hydnum rufescens UP504]